MTQSLLGLPMDDALSALRAAGQEPDSVTVIRAPRGNPPRGTLRVVRVREGGKELVCACFPDDVENNTELTKDA